MGVRTLSFCWVPWTAAALLSPVTPPTAVSSRHLAETLQSLDHALETRGDAAGGDPAPLVNACLAVCRALPGAQGNAAIPEDAVMLREAAAFFDWESADELGQHLFDASLWDDALEALARAVSRADCELAVEAAAAVMASARFVLLAPEARHVTPMPLMGCSHVTTQAAVPLPPASRPMDRLQARRDALGTLADAIASDGFIAARRRALAAAKLRRGPPRAANPHP